MDDEGDLLAFSFVPPVTRFAAALLDDPRAGRRITHLWVCPAPARRCAPHSWPRWPTSPR
ncbi:hypothetical protein ACU686_43060 [Yinghuangia aomiensis]